MGKIRNVLFDLDGTLVDTIDLIVASYRHTMMRHVDPVPDEDVWRATLGQPLWATFGLFTEDRDEIEAMIRTYREHNIAHHDEMIREYPGVREAVMELHARGATLGIVTSKLHDMALRGLRCCGYDSLFQVVVGADDVERHKPHPDPVLKAIDTLGLDPGATIYVGDSPHDMRAGSAAGVRTGAVLWGPFSRTELEETQPDLWLSAPRDLLLL